MKKIFRCCVPDIFFIIFSLFNNNPTSHITIFEAAKSGDGAIFEKYISEKENLNIKDSEGNTIFHVAAQHGHDHIIELVDQYDNKPNGCCDRLRHYICGKRRPDINAHNKHGNTPVHFSIKNGDPDIKTLLMLIWRGANPSFYNNKHLTPLLSACKKGKKEHALYLMNICDSYYHHVSKDNDNILHVTLSHDHQDLAEDIINFDHEIYLYDPEMNGHNALVTSKNTNGETPLHHCTKADKQAIAQLLLRYAYQYNKNKRFMALNSLDNSGYTPFAYACWHDHNYTATKNLFLDHKIDLNTPTHSCAIPLHIALSKNDNSFAERLLQYGALIDIQDVPNGNTALHIATYEGREHTIKWLLEHKANLNILNKQNEDCLSIALSKNDVNLVDYYIAHGANIDIQDINGQTIIMKKLAQSDNNAVVKLLRRNANLMITDVNGCNALHIAAIHNNYSGLQNILNDKAEHRSLLYKKNMRGNTPTSAAIIMSNIECFFALLDDHTVNITNNEQKTVVHIAIEKHESIHTINKILTYKVQLNLCDDEGSYLHHAINNKYDAAAELFMSYDIINSKNKQQQTPLSRAVQNHSPIIVHELLQHHAWVNIADDKGLTETHHAACAGDVIIFNMLYQRGANIEKRDGNGNTCLHLAAQRNHVDIINSFKAKASSVDQENDLGLTAFENAALCDQLSATSILLKEGYFINGKVEKTIEKLKYNRTHTRIFLEQKLSEINNECSSIINLQNQLKNLININKINNDLLKQRAIKDFSSYAYTYAHYYENFKEYSLDDLKKKYQSMRTDRLDFLQQAINHETKEKNELTARLKHIEDITHQKEIERKLTEQKQVEELHRQKEQQSLQQKLSEQNNTVSCNKTEDNNAESDDDEHECIVCFEPKKDAQRRCTNEGCSGRMCLDCTKDWKSRSTECPNCRQPLQ